LATAQESLADII